VGIGDDVAVLRAGADRVWLATCDVQVEGAHFLRAATTPADLGRKALAVNLSDIASAGGVPRFALVSLGLPKDLPVEFVDGLYAGLREAAARFGVDVVGGNISASRSGLFIDIFLLGEALPDEIVLRSGAQVGDQILVTGTLGDAAAGVALLLNGTLSAEAAYTQTARTRMTAPSPRVREGHLIGESRLATSMIDVSDGLAADLGHICQQSRVGARVYAERLPVTRANRALSETAQGDEWHFALHGGEDYELLFTAPKGAAEELSGRVTRETGTPVSVVGEILPAGEGQQLVLPHERVIPLAAMGWDHLKEHA
jgi:thiamine-monophosphate kinase